MRSYGVTKHVAVVGVVRVWILRDMVSMIPDKAS